MSAVLRHDGNNEDFIELFILTYRKPGVSLNNFGENVRMLRSLIIIIIIIISLIIII